MFTPNDPFKPSIYYGLQHMTAQQIESQDPSDLYSPPSFPRYEAPYGRPAWRKVSQRKPNKKSWLPSFNPPHADSVRWARRESSIVPLEVPENHGATPGSYSPSAPPLQQSLQQRATNDVDASKEGSVRFEGIPSTEELSTAPDARFPKSMLDGSSIPTPHEQDARSQIVHDNPVPPPLEPVRATYPGMALFEVSVAEPTPDLEHKGGPQELDCISSDIPAQTYVKAFLLDALPRQLYTYALLRLPHMYYSRVTRIFEEAELGIDEIKRGIITSYLEAKRPANENPWNVEPLVENAAYSALSNSWNVFIDSILREWKTLNLISVLLLSAILTLLQLEGAGADPLIRFTALLSMTCALMSLTYGCMFIIRFGSMRKTYKAAEWANESQAKRAGIWWNVWVLLAMPATWLGWSMILFIISIMSFVWRTGSTSDDNRGDFSAREALAGRITISVFLGLGLLYFFLILGTLMRYGDAMDRAWQQRVGTWINESHSVSKDPNFDTHATKRSFQTWTADPWGAVDSTEWPNPSGGGKKETAKFVKEIHPENVNDQGPSTSGQDQVGVPPAEQAESQQGNPPFPPSGLLIVEDNASFSPSPITCHRSDDRPSYLLTVQKWPGHHSTYIESIIKWSGGSDTNGIRRTQSNGCGPPPVDAVRVLRLGHTAVASDSGCATSLDIRTFEVVQSPSLTLASHNKLWEELSQDFGRHWSEHHYLPTHEMLQSWNGSRLRTHGMQVALCKEVQSTGAESFAVYAFLAFSLESIDQSQIILPPDIRALEIFT